MEKSLAVLKNLSFIKPWLILFGTTAFIFLFSTGFYWVEAGWLTETARQFFSTVCHQFSWRTFAPHDIHMAVCSRCFGIYSGLFVGAVLSPVFFMFGRWWMNYTILFAGIALLLNIADFSGNFIGLWTNTLYSRLITGLLLGLSASMFIVSAILKQIKS